MPALRLSMPRLSFDWLEGFGGRRVLLYSIYTLLLFLVFLIANFPHEVLVKRAVRVVDGLTVERARFAWFRGYELGGVQLKPGPRDADAPPLLESSSLYIRPGLDGLLRGKVESVFANGLFYGGKVDGSFRQVDGMTRAGLELNGVQIGRYPYLTGLLEEGQIGGKLSGAVTFEARGDFQSGRAAGELHLAGGGLQGVKINGMGVPDLNFGEVAIKFTLQGSKLEIEELRADGDELKVNGSGQVVVRGPVSDSVLNLKLTIVPGPASSDSVKGLLSLIPRQNGARPDAPVTVTGTLKSPRFR